MAVNEARMVGRLWWSGSQGESCSWEDRYVTGMTILQFRRDLQKVGLLIPDENYLNLFQNKANYEHLLLRL